MTNEYQEKIAKVKTAMDNRYENKQANKKTNISGDFTSDEVSYPTVQAVKAYVTGQGYLTQHQSLSNYIQKSSTAGFVKNDGTIDTTVYLTQHQSLSDIGGVVSVVEKQSPNSGYLKTYQITQNGIAVGVDIDIPKDFLVKSGSVKTVGSTATSAETSAGLSTGDLYLSLILNTKDNSTSTGDNELIIPANGLVEDTTYDADNSTLQLNSSTNVFSIKNAGVDTAQLKDASVTSDKIASAVKSTWLDNEDVDDRINQALDDLAELISPTVIPTRTVTFNITDEGSPQSYWYVSLWQNDTKIYESTTGSDEETGNVVLTNVSDGTYIVKIHDGPLAENPSQLKIYAGENYDTVTPITIDSTHTSFVLELFHHFIDDESRFE